MIALLARLFRRCFPLVRRSPHRPNRPTLEPLEGRITPSGALAPYQRGAPWSDRANRAFVDAQPPELLQRMYFNSPSAQKFYASYFKRPLRRWVHSADREGLKTDAELLQFLGARLKAHFRVTHRHLRRLYPGQSPDTYRLLMAMNLAHGYYSYATVRGPNRNVFRTLHMRAGDCTEIGHLMTVLAKAQGIHARTLGQSYNYPTPQGKFVASHVVAYAGGLWLDAEINVAFALDFRNLARIRPASRLEALLNRRRVFGFHNEYLRPPVRLAQLSRGLDGGILSFYYKYYFAGIGNGHTQLTLQPPP
jgi:hypothetical protein